MVNNVASIYDLDFPHIDGRSQSMAEYRGKVLLLVNTASYCGFTPQYEGLENLYRKYREQGLEVIAFPCNQFGAQEPGTMDEVQNFCHSRYEVSFVLTDKIKVNGSNAHPLYRFLKEAAPGIVGSRAVKWNFTKFLIGRDGTVQGRYSALTPPHKLERRIEQLLAQ